MSARLRWLVSAPLGDGGAVLSWVNPAHPGYAYPEIAGLWLRFASRHPQPPAAVAAVRARLRADGARGMVGRAGLSYLFDTAAALGGLIATGPAEAVEAQMFEAIASAIAERRAVREPTGIDRWSTRWTGHQLKVIAPLRRYAEATGDARAAALAGRLLEDFSVRGVEPFDRGDGYTHAFCYAVEGLLAAHAWGLGDFTRDLRTHAAALASWQRADGSLGAFRSVGAARADATAQAVRLWCAIDRGRYAGAVARALASLASLDAGEGGLRYEAGSDDVNTWATLFALQAEAWAEGASDVGDLW